MYGIPVPANSYFPNDFGIYGMAGNVAEQIVYLTDTLVMGGSFKTGPEYCKILNPKPYPFDDSKPQTDLGFRLVTDYESAVP